MAAQERPQAHNQSIDKGDRFGYGGWYKRRESFCKDARKCRRSLP
jgi:hypothetical protein